MKYRMVIKSASFDDQGDMCNAIVELEPLDDCKEEKKYHWEDNFVAPQLPLDTKDCPASECDGEECEYVPFEPKPYEEYIQDAKNKIKAGLANAYVKPKETSESLEEKLVHAYNKQSNYTTYEKRAEISIQIAKDFYRQNPKELWRD